ncbi:PREDICTED: uncharacterized protein LOC106125605 isoform X1 [Papilio xuthus]|uniref:Uncharacterized protein LOC106125605 isoform X1 n=1 Tax=Papilio xuthus TaxID=66420 RepID=A0AAJ6ZSR8_PAPXU|nr:PREDICTED: uncharacterized protein LOC106125605 isoform X1 [Papilio xuthus]
MSTISRTFINKSKYNITRRGKKLSLFEDSKIITALPKDIPERTWVEIFQKEENDLMIYDIREEIFETALNICYLNYMKKQNVAFTVHCAVKAWLKIIDWYFYRHDPGEEVSASPACFIPKREASWQPDEPPEPSPRDPFCRQKLVVLEDETKDIPKEGFSITSLDYPVIEEIPEECWFPGRVNIELEEEDISSEAGGSQDYEVSIQSYPTLYNYSVASSTTSVFTSEDNLVAESEVLQKVTDYSSDKALKADSPKKKLSRVAQSTVTMGSAEASVKSSHSRRQPYIQPLAPSSQSTRSRATLPPLSTSSQSRLSIISDCRLRNLRLDTQFEVGSEKVDLSSVENVKRK